MTTKGAILQGTLALIGLGAAYATWQREPERAPGEVVVLDLTRNDVSKVRYEDGKRWIEVEPDGKREAVWLRVSAEGKAPERRLRGNEASGRLLDRFAPLRASRALGTLGADKLKEFGLDAPKKKITVTSRGRTTVLLIGSSPYGVSDPYVKDESSGRVYLLAGPVLSDLDGASVRLVDRSLHDFTLAEFDRLTVTAGGKKRDFVVTGGRSHLTARLASPKTPDKPDELAKNWHEKVWRASVADALGEGEKPAAGQPTVALRLDYFASEKTRGWVEIARLPLPQVADSPGPPPAEIYARSNHTAGWMRLPASSEELIKEGEKLAATE